MTGTPRALVARQAAELKPQIEDLFLSQWNDPELPGMEFRSSTRLVQFLGSQGFTVERAPGNVPTAFVARAVHGAGPVVAILAEYDALPGLAAAASSSHQPLPQAAGHGCGHNHIGPANSAAAVIAARVLRELGLAGEVRVIGCPAEEILWGKIALLKAGIFDGIDAILTSHGDYQNGAVSRPCQSVAMGEFVFLGQAGHGGFKRAANALSGAEALVTGAERSVRDAFPAIQLRHVFRRAGITPGITPDEARVWYSARGAGFDQVRAAYEMIATTARRVAAEQGLGVREQFIAETRGYLPNDVLGRVLDRSLHAIGPPRWTPDDLAFMAELSARCSPDQAMVLARGLKLHTDGEDYYGQDDGEVSWRVPLGRLNWAYPEQVPIHHWGWTALSGHAASFPGPLMAMEALAQGTIALLADPALLGEAKAELVRRTNGLVIGMPRLGAQQTMRTHPESFWDATWTEEST